MLASWTRTRIALSSLTAAVALSACAHREPLYPVRGDAGALPPPAYVPPPPPPPPPPPRNPEIPEARPTTPVETKSLPPVGAAASVRMRMADTGVFQPTPAQPWPKQPAALETPREAVVGRGETLFDVAERVRTPVRAIIELNDLQPPYTLAPGTKLRIPPPLVYEVADGDTIFGVARRFNIDPRSLANLNDIQLETALRRGRKIALPSLARDQGVNAQATGAPPVGGSGTAMASAAPAPLRSLLRNPLRPAPRAAASAVTGAAAATTVARAPAGAAVPAIAPAASDEAVAVAGRGKFAWPLRGQILSAFGPKGPGQRNDGVNIAANPGDDVKAAAGGEVVFAGDLPDFGKLVLLKHPGGWVTAYAHLSKTEVKMRQTVSQGQSLGEAGQSGLVDRPQLHFEIRYSPDPRDKARPVNPAVLLSGAG